MEFFDRFFEDTAKVDYYRGFEEYEQLKSGSDSLVVGFLRAETLDELRDRLDYLGLTMTSLEDIELSEDIVASKRVGPEPLSPILTAAISYTRGIGWFQLTLLLPSVPETDWEPLPSRLQRRIRKLIRSGVLVPDSVA